VAAVDTDGWVSLLNPALVKAGTAMTLDAHTVIEIILRWLDVAAPPSYCLEPRPGESADAWTTSLRGALPDVLACHVKPCHTLCVRRTVAMPILRSNPNLLDGFRAGKPEALTTVYWEYVRRIEQLLSAGFDLRSQGTRIPGVGGKPDFADLVQEVFARAFSEKGRRGYDGLRNYGPYLYAIARNILIDRSREQRREIAVPFAKLEAAIDTQTEVPDPEPWAVPATMKLVEEYLAALPHDLREVHRIRYEEGHSQEQAAEELGVGRQTLRTLEQRLRNGLAAALDHAGAEEVSESQTFATPNWNRETVIT
jgi:RNA polymerase sigma-70 factor, ECF subfamily